MATSESLTALNWLARTYAPALLNVLGRADLADNIRGNLDINNTTRMEQLTTRLAALEADCWTEYVPEWDPFWPQAQDYVISQVISGNQTLIDTTVLDPDRNVALCLKTAFRALEMSALRFLANGGVL